MNLIRWKNAHPTNGHALTLVDPWRDLDRMFDRVFGEQLWGDSTALQQAPAGLPVALDLTENEQGVVVRAEVPGVAPEKLEITLHEDVLTIAGEKLDEKTEDKDGYQRSERRFGAFRRSVQLPSTVDPDSVEAAHQNGVVTITLKKAASAQPKRVEVKKA